MTCKSMRPACPESNPMHSDLGTSARDRAPIPGSTGLSFSATPAWTWSQITQRCYPAPTQNKIRLLATNLSFLDQIHNEPRDLPLTGGVSSAQRMHDAESHTAYAEHMDNHSESVAAMANLRETIKKLTPDELQVPVDQFHTLITYLNQKTNDLAPYYTQMGNINLLEGERHRAWKRTCNVTSLSMALEGLGVGPSQFSGDLALLERIGAALEPWRFDAELAEDKRVAKHNSQVAKRNAKGKRKGATVSNISPEDDWGACFSSLDKLRMPDFVQYVAVYHAFNHPQASGKKKRVSHTAPEKAFLQDVLVARDHASGSILSTDTLVQLAKEFEGVQATSGTIEESIYGTVNYDLKKTKREEKNYVKEQLEKFQKDTAQKLVKGSPEEQQEIEAIRSTADYKKLADQEQADENEIAPLRAQLEKNVNIYRKHVMNKIQPKTDDGAQVVINRKGHFMKLHSIQPEGLIMDDPWVPGKNSLVKWRQAYEEGYFRSYIILTR
jgi:hypothetical protein